jgi:hypothetical protein
MVLLLGVFLIPVTVSSLRGLTHVLTCDQDVRTPFTVDTAGGSSITSSARFTRGEPTDLCGGLRLNMSVGPISPEKVRVTLPITNESKYAWQGSVELKLGGTTVPIDIGEIKPGATETDTVDVKAARDITEIEGSLLIGP